MNKASSAKIADLKRKLKEVRKELKESQRLANVGSWSWIPKSDTFTWSKELYRIFRRDPGLPPLSYKELPHFFTPESFARMDAAVKRAIRTGKPVELDLEIVRPDGTRRLITARGKAHRDADGHIERLSGILQDITERVRRKQQAEAYHMLLETVVNHIPVAVNLIRGSDLRSKLVNSSYQSMAPKKEMAGKTLDAIWPETGQDFSGLCRRVLETGEPYQVEDELNMVRRQPDGPLVPAYFSWSLHRVRLPGDEGWGILNTAWETTARKQSEEALRESEERFRVAQELSPDGFTILRPVRDREGRVIDFTWVYENAAIARMNGTDPQTVVGRRLLELFPGHSQSPLFATYRQVATTGESRIEEASYKGESIHRMIWFRVVVVRIGDGDIAILAQDITERKRLEDDIRHMAHHDSLTGLLNRSMFMDIAQIEMTQAKRDQKKLAILYLDLDRFKEVNDTLGHNIGDALLKEVASRLKGSVRASDKIARIGGDEFNIILADVAAVDYVADVAGKLVETFHTPFLVGKNELHVTASAGISFYPDDSEDIGTLLRYADIAMYHAKESGRNTYQFYNPEINIRSLERMKMEGMLRRTVELGELVVYYQPQIDIATRKMVCAEALVRWQHPDMGLLEPAQFIPLAEKTGFITAIDEWALRSACTQIKAWMDTGISPSCVTVNLSARQFQRQDIAEKVAAILQETGLPAEHLDLEITESTAMSNIGRTTTHLEKLAKMGVHISLDDFGTGYSSLNYLKRLPIQTLKIDKSFIKDIATDPDDRAIITAVTAMAHSMKLKVIAEGVETEDQLSFLQSKKCDEAQGFLFSKPVPAEKFMELFAAGR